MSSDYRVVDRRTYGPYENLEVGMEHKKPEEEQRTHRQKRIQTRVRENISPDGWIQRMSESTILVTEQEVKKIGTERHEELMENDIDTSFENDIDTSYES